MQSKQVEELVIITFGSHCFGPSVSCPKNVTYNLLPIHIHSDLFVKAEQMFVNVNHM